MLIPLHILSFFINLIPKAVRFHLGNTIGSAFYYLIGFRKEIILSNLKLAFGETHSDSEIKKIAVKNYQHYGNLFFEFLASVNWKKEDYLKKVKRVNWEKIEELSREKKPAFILTSHLGNWEFSIATAAAVGIPIDVVVKESKTKLAEKYIQWYRRRTGAGIFLESGTAKDILRSCNQGRQIGFILDQFMGPPIGLPVTFFGKKAGTAAALALLTEGRDVPIIPGYNYRDEKGDIVIVMEDPVDFGTLPEDKNERLYYKTQIFNNILESHVRKHPEHWLWLHRRWKDFNGESRWQLAKQSAIATTLLLALFGGCSSQKQVTPTGIELPTDPTITAPVLSGKTKNLDETTTEASKTAAATPTPTPTPLATPATKSKKGKKMEQKVATPPPTPIVPAPDVPVKAVDVVPADKIPFEIGERIEMDLRWLALPAGRGVLEVKEGPTVAGRPTFHFWGNILSSKIVDAVYHVDNTVESFVDKEALIPYKYLLHMLESGQKKETRVSFDHPQKKAYFWAKRISEKWGPEDIDRQDALVPEARDMFSALYFARALNYQLNKKQSFTIYENANNWNIELTPVGYELVNSSVGAFQCWKILVNVTLNNVLKPTGDIFVWFSDDSKRYLVKFDAKLKIGSLYGNLTSIREH